jgi:hypothetical protein
MRTTIRQQVDAAGRGDAYCQSHPDPNPANALVATHLHDLYGRALILDQVQHQAQKAREEAVDRKEALRGSIAGNLKAVAGISKAVARTQPGITVHLQLPHGRINETRFLTTSRVAVAEALAQKDALVTAGMPDGLLDTLTAELNEYESALNRQRNAMATQVAASAELVIVAREIVAVLKHLDALFRLRYKKEPEQLRSWMSARNVFYRLAEPAAPDDRRSGESNVA